MFSNMKWMLIKNDIDKMIANYEKDKELRPQIIDRLFEMGAKDELLDLASWDNYYRNRIVEKITEAFELTLEDCINILRWLHLSQTHRYFVKLIINKFSDRDLSKIVNARGIDPVVISSIRNMIKKMKRKDPSEKVDESYLKLKMLVEDLDLESENIDSSHNIFNHNIPFRDNVENFLNMLKNLSEEEEFAIISESLKKCLSFSFKDTKLILTLLNLSRISIKQKKILIKEIDSIKLYFPEFYQSITDTDDFDLALYGKFFSTPTSNGWAQTYIETNLTTVYINLIRDHKEFAWLEDFIPENLKKFYDNVTIKDFSYLLTSELGYTLYELEFNREIISKFEKTSLEIHKEILHKITKNETDFEDNLRILLLIGGELNYEFFTSILKRNVVENTEETLKTIEANYLELKQKIDDPSKLTELIDNEIKEKSELISRTHYSIVLGVFLKSFIKVETVHASLINTIKKNLPNLDRALYLATISEKIEICKLICALKLENYNTVLVNLSNSDDTSVALYAAIALVNMDHHESFEKLIHFTKSPNYIIKKLAAQSLHILPLDKIRETLLLMIKDENIEVVEEALNTLTKYPNDEVIPIFKKLSENPPFHIKRALVKSIAKIKNVKMIPILVEFLKTTDHILMREVIQAFSEINNQGSIEVLKNIDLKGNHSLEMERAKALVKLGDINSWNILKKLLRVNISIVQIQAKHAMIELATSANVKELESFTSDPNPLVAASATAKIYVYDQQLGWHLILRLLARPEPLLQYYIAHLLRFFPFNKVKQQFAKLQQSEDFKIKTIIAIFLDEQGISSLWKKIENNILKLKSYDLLRIMDALEDYPYKKSINILEKIAILQDPELMEKIVLILQKFKYQDISRQFIRMWKMSDNDCKLILASLLGKIQDVELIDFIYEQMRSVNLAIQVELSYALVAQGDNKGWEILRDLLNNDKIEVKKYAIGKIASFKTISALKILEKQGLTPDVKVQEEIIKGIGEMGLRDSLPILERFIRSSVKKVKIAVAKALGNLPYPRADKMLKILLQDTDHYVKVTAEIALSKLKSGPTIPLPPVREIFEKIMEKPQWKLTEKWFIRSYNEMEETYSEDELVPLKSFGKKLIIDKEHRAKKINAINKRLNETLAGCSDVQKIIQSKETASREIARMATFSELIKAVLYAPREKISKAEVLTIRHTLKTGHPEIVKAVIFASGFSEEKHWLFLLDQIMLNYYDPKIADVLIYSIVKKRTSYSLYLLSHLVASERARYYFVMIYNYLISNPELINPTDLPKITKVIFEKKVSKEIKEVVTELVKNLSRSIVK